MEKFFRFSRCTWGSYCQISFKSTIDINMRWFQIKILNRILYMKDSLLRFGVVADKKCTFVVTMMKLSYMFFAL